MARADKKKRKKAKKPKEPFVARMKRRGREAYGLGQTLVHEPRAFPGACGGLLKRSFRTMWEARGGGFYACGFVLTFIWLEISTLFSELMSATGVGSFLSDQLLEFLFRFSLQSIGNTVQAFVWPALIIDEYELWGIAGIAISYLLFSQFLKSALTKWLFADADAGLSAVAQSSGNGDQGDKPV
ncbi:hypothetical protein [Woeseia oceani]|uniref:Uncharacterized protein n=1 Tax=Woeseia oceani TaxID=1548547 RepID=A0A193LIK9_9GAMM|nr:hypothetical protein [Woeseia oceani]ANO52355.1 hypothetical protein BA177_15210 [Woeseia oceani]